MTLYLPVTTDSGELHAIAVSDRGRLAAVHHSREEVRRWLTLAELGNDDGACRCIRLLDDKRRWLGDPAIHLWPAELLKRASRILPALPPAANLRCNPARRIAAKAFAAKRTRKLAYTGSNVLDPGPRVLTMLPLLMTQRGWEIAKAGLVAPASACLVWRARSLGSLNISLAYRVFGDGKLPTVHAVYATVPGGSPRNDWVHWPTDGDYILGSP